MTIERDLRDGPCHLRAAYNPVAISGALPDVTAGDAVDFSYTVSSVNGPVTCSIASGALPSGLSMDSSGRVTGEALVVGVYAWTVRGVDALGYVTTHDDSSEILGMTIHGHLPDGKLGDVVSYQYTVTGGVEPVVMSVSSGEFPADLAMDESGLVGGTVSEAGTFTPVIHAVDAAGNEAWLDDVVRIGKTTWWLTAAGAASSLDKTKLWISDDPRDWTGGAVFRAPFTITASFGPKWMGGDVALIVGAGADVERTTTLEGSAGVLTEKTTIGSGIAKLWASGDVYVASLSSSSTWYTSIDYGVTWQSHTDPGGGTIQSIVRMDSGRWIAYRDAGSSERFVYSDETVPTTWTLGTVRSAAAGRRIATSGGVAVCATNSGGANRTVDGASWSVVTATQILADSRGASANGDTFIIVGQNYGGSYGGIQRSGDAGLTWGPVSCPITTFTRVEYGAGYWVATASSGVLYVSADDGLTWAASSTPSVAQATFNAAPIFYVP